MRGEQHVPEEGILRERPYRSTQISQTADDWRGDIEVSGEYQIAFSDKEKFPELDECIQNAQALEYIVYNYETSQYGADGGISAGADRAIIRNAGI